MNDIGETILRLCREGVRLRDPDGRPYPHPYRINSGLCEQFAQHVKQKTSSQCRLDCPENHREDAVGKWNGHVWITDGQKFYDAEEPFGVEDWRRLPIFLRQHSVVQP